MTVVCITVWFPTRLRARDYGNANDALFIRMLLYAFQLNLGQTEVAAYCRVILLNPIHTNGHHSTLLIIVLCAAPFAASAPHASSLSSFYSWLVQQDLLFAGNTLSNLSMIIPPLYGIYETYRHQFEVRFTVCFVLLIG